MLQCDKYMETGHSYVGTKQWIFHLIIFLPVAIALLTSALIAPYILLFDSMLLEAGILLVRFINQQLHGLQTVNNNSERSCIQGTWINTPSSSRSLCPWIPSGQNLLCTH